MFIEVDVVEFMDVNIPFRTVLVNAGIMHIEPIAAKHRKVYEMSRNKAIEMKSENPDVFVSPVEHLPQSGAVIYMLGAMHAPHYFTVTPYAEIRARVLGIKTESV